MTIFPDLRASSSHTNGFDSLPWSNAARQMVKDQIQTRGIKHPQVLAAMASVPRHRFVCDDMASQAYEDHPLGISEGQTISQPYMVALMTEALDPRPGESVLEIGTGCGYQTAVLCELYDHVYSVERYPSLSKESQACLGNLGYRNFSLLAGDGSLGWPEHAPYDAIIVTAASPEIPEPLLKQLKGEGSTMVLPVGDKNRQQLIRIMQTPYGKRTEILGDVRFVPLIGSHGW
ncbi:MAG: protein-L-isoaspartate(D-aspartate) O-methyltransferase [Vampirovibrio sp.]|nr:protein-L-isoaspartate(D-aspartate) O-methyltransferase [Vampirovibrio sp.]